ncbi:hypothetical protein M0805_005535 [Coniferiporia weirii]|nr:hypothetical protein M0805_005535 [Coniferiporia weirii]
MAAPAVKAAKVPPSPFSALLRRSKFASYDNKIGQVYTTYGGSAARGDWGLKRPLAVRNRDAHLSIYSVDTLYQQTVWVNTHDDAVFVRKFEEMDVTPRIDPLGDWAPRFGVQDTNWLHDSDFADKPDNPADDPRVDYLKRTRPLPNTNTMSDRRFERYLRKVRRLSPEFGPFLMTEERKKQGGAVASLNPSPVRQPLYAEAKFELSREHQSFLTNKFEGEITSKDSKIIRPLPHPAAGLVYTPTTDLRTALMSKPLPGRVLNECSSKTNNRNATAFSVRVAVGGWVGRTSVSKKHDSFSMTDFGTESEPRKDVEAGEGMYKPTYCAIVSPPQVVGRFPQRVDSAAFKMDFTNWDRASDVRLNPHKPGTREYVAHQELDHTRRFMGSTFGSSPLPPPSYGYRKPSMTNPRNPVEKEGSESKQSAHDLLGRLMRMTPRKVEDEEL